MPEADYTIVKEKLKGARDNLIDRGIRNNKLLNTNLNSTTGKSLKIQSPNISRIFNSLYVNNLPLKLKPRGNNAGADAQGSLRIDADDASVMPKLRTLFYESRSHEEETGVNVLYLALGFVKWFERDDSNEERFAPLVLLPVEIERDGANDKYTVKVRDDDLLTNLSLKFRIKDLDIDFPNIPESGLKEWDINEYFDSVERAISGQNRWQVLKDRAVLGFFSFSKLMLWSDLDSEKWGLDTLAQHNILQKLLSLNQIDGADVDAPLIPQDALIDDCFTPKQLQYVVDADSSQTEAIQSALIDGRNLVIQGPPGTGKSQTITNIIAGAIGQKKTVLFLAEKIDALKVVYDRLDKANLGAACLELHSRSATKAELRKQLKAAINLYQRPTPTGTLDKLTTTQTFLNDYSKRVHQKVEPFELSPFEIIAELSLNKRQRPTAPKYYIPETTSYSKDKLEELTIRLKDIADRILEAGTPAKHPWAESSPTNEMFESTLDRQKINFVTIVNRLNSLALLANEINIDYVNCQKLSIGEISRLKTICDIAQLAPNYSAEILNSSFLYEKRAEIRHAAELIFQYLGLCGQVNEHFTDAWLEQDVKAIHDELVGYSGSFFCLLIPKYRAANRLLKGILKQGSRLSHKHKIDLLNTAIRANYLKSQINIEQFSAHQELITTLRSKSYHKRAEFLNNMSVWLNERVPNISEDRKILAEFINTKKYAKLINDLATGAREVREQIQNTIDSNEIRNWGFETLSLSALVNKFSIWESNINKYNQWFGIYKRLEQIKPQIGEKCYKAIYDGEIKPENLIHDIRSEILEDILNQIFRKDEKLSTPDRALLDQNVLIFRSTDRERLKRAQNEILHTYSSNLPTGTAGSMGVIKQEIEKSRNRMPTRKLIESHGGAIQKLKPVFLMSPMSVAQFLKPKSITFDLVIIDEASQIRPSDALGAIARAKQLVVVGDQKQLPPTNFFSQTITDDESNTEDFALDDVESVLDLCSATIANKVMLRWHYRSQHPSLIATSNKNFYENKLLLPPSVLLVNHADGIGLSFIKTPPNGYTRGGANAGRNTPEASKIAEEVIKFARLNPEKSLGVVAFSVSQRDVIRDLIDNARRENPDTEPFFSLSRPAPFFVKNLESVQGDERDVIFISVGYGRSDDGTLYQNFGPLNQIGGERRLNVLITRAKEQCSVFSSIVAEDINANPEQLGVNSFKEFLQFAEKGYFESPINTGMEYDSPFEESVALFLAQRGYKVVPQVGMGAFRIDIGVVDPENPNKFLCGVECDGATYHSSRSARDRDRLRHEILEKRGWKIWHIWSTDWFKNRANEELRLLRFLDRPVTPSQNIALPDTNEITADTQEVPAPLTHDIYKEYKDKRSDHTHAKDLRKDVLTRLIIDIIKCEGPVHEDIIIKRVASSCNQERAGSRTKEVTLECLQQESTRVVKLLINENGFWRVASGVETPIRQREQVLDRDLLKIDYIYPGEIIKSLIDVVKDSVKIGKDDLIKETSRTFGLSTVTGDIKLKISRIIHTQLGKTLKSENGEISLLN
jgi:very-short-patch-repair endonuclease